MNLYVYILYGVFFSISLSLFILWWWHWLIRTHVCKFTAGKPEIEIKLAILTIQPLWNVAVERPKYPWCVAFGGDALRPWEPANDGANLWALEVLVFGEALAVLLSRSRTERHLKLDLFINSYTLVALWLWQIAELRKRSPSGKKRDIAWCSQLLTYSTVETRSCDGRLLGVGWIVQFLQHLQSPRPGPPRVRCFVVFPRP